MERDKLEQFVVKNKDAFKAPVPDIWDKIEKREPQKKGVVIPFKLILSRAAAVIVIFISSYYFHDYRANQAVNSSSTETEAIAENSEAYQQMMEAENYYTAEIQDKTDEFNRLTKNSPDLQKDLNRDLSELDAIFLELKKDLSDNANNQEVLESMIRNYMLKLEILQDMLDQIKQTKIQNNEYEKVYSI